MHFHGETIGLLLAGAALLAPGLSAAGEPAPGGPSIQEMLVAIGEAVDEAPSAPAAEAAEPPGTASAPAPAADEGGRLEAVLAEIGSLMEKRDYAAARRRAESAAAESDLASASGALRSAAGVARALGDRLRAIRAAIDVMKGMPVTLQTSAGRRKGDVESVSDEGVVLAARNVINGRVRGITRHAIAWADLAPAEEDRLSKAWVPEEPEGTVALAALAFGRGELDAAEKILLLAAAHPYAEHLRGRIAAIRREAAEAAAGAAWEGLLGLAKGELDAAAAEKATALLDAFVKGHAATALVRAKAEEIAKLRTRLELATAPGFPLNYALAANGSAASGCARPGELIDGNVTEYTGSTGFATTGWKQDPPPSMVVTLAKAVPVNVVYFRLWDGDARFYRYKAAVSPDAEGDRWVTVADFTDEEHKRKSWQTIVFPIQAVRRVSVTGTYNSANNGFYVVELEAYHAPVGFTPEKIVEAIEKARPPRPPKPPRGEEG